MKNLKNFIVILTIAFTAAFVSSCTEDEPIIPNPTLAFVQGLVDGDITVNAGDTINTGVTATGETEFEKFEIYVNYDGSVNNNLVLDTAISGTVYNQNFSFRTRTTAGTERWIFRLTDKEGKFSEIDFTVTTTNVMGGNIDSYSARMLGSFQSAVGSFLSTGNGTVYTVSGADMNQGLIDLIYFYGTTNQATLAAPDDNSFGTGAGQISSLGVHNWTTKNATRFKATTVSTTDFDAISDDLAIIDAYDNNANMAESKVNMLSVDDVIAFVTSGGKKGLAKVTAITTGQAGEITIDVKVQQ